MCDPLSLLGYMIGLKWLCMLLQAQGLDEGVPLSNSVSVSDKPRIRFLVKKAKERNSADQYPFRHGEYWTGLAI